MSSAIQAHTGNHHRERQQCLRSTLVHHDSGLGLVRDETRKSISRPSGAQFLPCVYYPNHCRQRAPYIPRIVTSPMPQGTDLIGADDHECIPLLRNEASLNTHFWFVEIPVNSSRGTTVDPEN